MARSLVIRADADARIGIGHTMRCLALAQAWIDADKGSVWLASTNVTGEVRGRYEREGVRVLHIDAEPRDICRVVRQTGASWVALDGYAFGLAEQGAIEASGARSLVIDDDGAAGEYVADLVVDPNVFATPASYERRSARTRLLLGPRYALLRRELRGRPARRLEPPRRVLVTFGGADPADFTLTALQAVISLSVEAIIVVGPANQRHEELKRASQGARNVRLVWDAPDMRALIDDCDVAIAAAGGTCLELAHAGVPQIVAVAAANQRRVAEGLVREGLALSLGGAGAVTASGMREMLASLLADASARADMAARGPVLVDGDGPARVVAQMVEPYV